MGALMPEYIRVVNKTYGYTEKIVNPISFTCALSMNYDKNSMSFSLPLNEGILDIGTLIMYPGWNGEFGGRIKVYDIDEEKQIVKYTGDSWTGLLNNYVVELTPNGNGISLRSDSLYPGDQNSLTSSLYPRNGIYPYLYYTFDVLGLPFDALPCDIYQTNDSLHFHIKEGATLAEAMKAMASATGFVPVIRYTDDNRILTINFVESTHHGVVVEDVFDVVPPYVSNMVYTQEDAINAIFGVLYGYTEIAYLANDATYKAQRVYNPNQPYDIPSDLMFSDIDMITEWKSGLDGPDAMMNTLKSDRESALTSKISTEITYPYGRGYGLDMANIGDFVTLRMRKAKKEQEQKILKKTLKLKNGTPYVTVSFG